MRPTYKEKSKAHGMLPLAMYTQIHIHTHTHAHTIEYYSAMRKNDTLPFVKT